MSTKKVIKSILFVSFCFVLILSTIFSCKSDGIDKQNNLVSDKELYITEISYNDGTDLNKLKFVIDNDHKLIARQQYFFDSLVMLNTYEYQLTNVFPSIERIRNRGAILNAENKLGGLEKWKDITPYYLNYNSSNQLLSQTSNNGKVDTLESYQYLPKKIVLKISNFITTYLLDDNNNVIEEASYRKNGKDSTFIYKKTFKYDTKNSPYYLLKASFRYYPYLSAHPFGNSKNNIIEIHTISRLGNSSEFYTYEYNSKQLPIKFYKSTTPNGIVQQSGEFKYVE